MSGIEYDKVKEYWGQRAKEQGKGTVGFANRPLNIQDEEYNERFEFIIPKINTELITLDYGCGVGRYSKFFKPDKYVGVDITQDLLNIAKEENSEYKYVLQTTPDLSCIGDINFQQFFSATVLQHNSDEGVDKILFSLRKLVSDKTSIILYENTFNYPNSEGRHIKFRSVDEYKRFVETYFIVENFQFFTHIIHGEEHSLIIFNCK